jgi:ferredoxin-NADP reductase
LESLNLTVVETFAATQEVRVIRLVPTDAAVLPSWEPGAHIKIALPDGDTRSYSLINISVDPAATLRPQSYLIGVRLEEQSQGGSRFMHGLQVGDTVAASPPSNNFPLASSTRAIVLLAGGIGVTPILSMTAALAASGHAYRVIYAGRSRARLALLQDIERIAEGHLEVHADDEKGILFDVRALMSGLTRDEPLYVCGPTPMIEAAIASAQELGWAQGRLRFEIFSAAAPQAGDASFEVVLKTSGRTFEVPAGKSILDVLLEAGDDPLYDCKRGDCGICQVSVIEGIPDHRDYVLTQAERASNKIVQICVSRSKTPRLVLDL